jgi:hypothetical protein
MRDMSAPTIEQPLNKQVIEKYLNYEKPINRTVDIINNNSSFMSQIYTVIKLGYLEKPSEEKFHEFFIRLIEEELRRETDGWNEYWYIGILVKVRSYTTAEPGVQWNAPLLAFIPSFRENVAGGRIVLSAVVHNRTYIIHPVIMWQHVSTSRMSP